MQSFKMMALDKGGVIILFNTVAWTSDLLQVLISLHEYDVYIGVIFQHSFAILGPCPCIQYHQNYYVVLKPSKIMYKLKK